MQFRELISYDSFLNSHRDEVIAVAFSVVETSISPAPNLTIYTPPPVPPPVTALANNISTSCPGSCLASPLNITSTNPLAFITVEDSFSGLETRISLQPMPTESPVLEKVLVADMKNEDGSTRRG